MISFDGWTPGAELKDLSSKRWKKALVNQKQKC